MPEHAVIEHFADTEHGTGLDADQRMLYMLLALKLCEELRYFIATENKRSRAKRNIERLNVLILGASGSGKSSAINAFKRLADWEGVPHWIITTAKTGKAAANVNGETYDRLL
jgi:predicted GTPase